MPKLHWLSSLLFAVVLSCESPAEQKRLPILGPMELGASTSGGYDTTFFDYPDFHWLDQDSIPFTPDTLINQVFLVDFFFTTCPSICIDMQRELKRVYAAFGERADFRIVSHTIDPDYDQPSRLKAYANNSNVKNRNWLFVNGPSDEVYRVAQQAYLSLATKDSIAPGGFLHSGTFILLDHQKKIRGVYEGTSPEDVDRLLQELPFLLAE